MRTTIHAVKIGENQLLRVVSKEYFDNIKKESEAGYSYDLLLPECSETPTCSIVSYEGESPNYFGLVQLNKYKFNCSWEQFFTYVEHVFDWEIPAKQFDLLNETKIKQLGTNIERRYIRV